MTSVFGGYDWLRPQQEQDIDVRWLAIVDRPTEAPAPWQVVECHAHEGQHPRVGSKWHRFFSEGIDDDVVWIDGNMKVTSPAFAREALACRNDGMAVWQHPRRDCIFDEAQASVDLVPKKYAHTPILEQAAAYRAEGHPEHWGLYANGTIAWDWRGSKVRDVAAMWWDEVNRWTYQDQVSLPVVCRRLGVRPGVFPFSQIESRRPFGNRWLTIDDHLLDT